MLRACAPWAIAFAVIANASAGPLPCATTDRDCARKAALAHPVRSVAFWTRALERPVEKRLGPAPPELVEYLTLDNVVNGFPERPRSANPSGDFLADVRAAIEELPAAVKSALGKDFAGLYFVDDLGGTGYTDYIHDGARLAGGFIVLDAAVLAKRRANEWATWKENTPFAQSAPFALQARIAAFAEDNRKSAIQYILLHELGHVMSIGAKVHPAWTLRPNQVPPSDEFPYFRLSWRIDRDKNRYVSIFDDAFVERARVVYYVGPKLKASDMARVYSRLEGTNFPTLYAATQPGDDFAEAFANYVHVVMLKKTFEITIWEQGRTIKTYGPCWQEARCAEKRRVLESLLTP